MRQSVASRRQTLARIVPTPRTLPAFDLAAFVALPLAERRARWSAMDLAGRLVVAHAVMAHYQGYSDDAGAAERLAALEAKLGGQA